MTHKSFTTQKTDITYEKFLRRFEEVLDLPPQRLGVFTPLYKSFVRRVKVMPWPWFLLVSIVIVFGVYMLVGSTITLLVSLLQKGF